MQNTIPITKILELQLNILKSIIIKHGQVTILEHHYVIRGDLIYMNFAKSKYVYSYDKKNVNLINKEIIEFYYDKRIRWCSNLETVWKTP